MGGENKFVSGRDSHEGTKPSRTRAHRSADLHGPKPKDGFSGEVQEIKKSLRHQGNERVSTADIADEVEAVFGFRPEVGARFTDTAEPNEVYEITHVFDNGRLEIEQTSDVNGGNYRTKRIWNVAQLRGIMEQSLKGSRKWAFLPLSTDENEELARLLISSQTADQITVVGSDVPVISENLAGVPENVSGDSISDNSLEFDGDPPGMIRPRSGKIRGANFGGITIQYDDSAPDLNEENSDTRAIDAQQIIGGRRRKSSTRKLKQQPVIPIQLPELLETSEVQGIEVEPNPTDNNPADTMKFEQTSSVVPKSAEGARNESGNDQYKDGSVWVEEYLKETDQQADQQEALQREPIPAVVRTRNHPLHTENQKTQTQESNGDIENTEIAPPGSAQEAVVFAAFDRGPNGEIGATPEGKLRQRIDAATLACDQARLEYVTADNESRTVMSRLKGVLGISDKGIQNETVGQKKEIYQTKLRELRDLRLAMVKMRHDDRIASQANLAANEVEESKSDLVGAESGLDIGEPSLVPENEHLLEKELESELRHFAQEVNIGLYNAWTELKSEQKGIFGKLKQFGAAYNQLSWQKKLVIGIPVAGLAVASGAGLLGTAMASAAIAAVIARRGVAAAGMFAATEGGLQKLAESRAQKMAEKIVANGQQEAKSLENLNQGDTNEAGAVGSETQSSPEANEESLDAKLERMKTFMDNHMIDSLDQTLESRVRGQDRRRLSALAGSMGVAFGLPSFMASETGHELTRAAAEKAGKAASWVGETVLGDDYPGAKPADISRGAPSTSPSETITETKAPAPATIERGASGAALESSAPAKGVELGGNISGILGKEITLVKGDSVWKLAGNIAKELGVKGEAESLYVTDALKDAYLAHGGNPNIQAGTVFDWKKYLSAEDIQKALKGAGSLTAEQKTSILANKGKDIANAVLTEKVASDDVFTVGDNPQNIVGGESQYPDVLARARVQLAGNSPSTGVGVMSSGVAAQSGAPAVTTVTNGAQNYQISGVHSEQLVSNTEPASVSEAGRSGIVVESVPQSLGAFEASRQVGGGAEGFVRVADTAWEGNTPTVNLIAIEQVKPIVDKVPNMTCQEFFQVYLDAKDGVSNNYDQIDSLTFQGGLNWAEVDTFAQFINGFTDPDSGRKLIVQAVRANPNITLKEFIEMYAPSAEIAPSSIGGQVENVVPNTGSESIASPEVPATVVAESAPSAPVENFVPVSAEEPGLREEPLRQEPSTTVASSQEAPTSNTSEQPLVATVDTGVVTAANESRIAISDAEGDISSGETLAFSQHVEPSRESFQQVRYEAAPQQGGTGRGMGMSARAGMPPAGGFESYPKIPGIGSINLMELQSAEQKLQFGPAAKLTLRQLAESTKDPSKIPNGMTSEDVAKVKRLLARVPGTSTGAFILQNGNITVRQFIQDNIRARIPRPGSTSI